jgi:hypothetical protein
MLPGPLFDPGDIAAYGASRNTVRNSGARTVSSRSSTFQAARASWTLRRQAVADAAAGSGEVAQAKAHSQRIARVRLPSATTLPRSCSGLCSAVARLCRWRFCRTRRSGSTGRMKRHCAARGRIAGRSRQALLRSGLHSQGQSTADPRNAVRPPRAGGVPRRGIRDNMRTAVDKIGRGKER